MAKPKKLSLAIKKRARELRRQLDQLDKPTGRSTERERDAARKRRIGATRRPVIIPPCRKPTRRKR